MMIGLEMLLGVFTVGIQSAVEVMSISILLIIGVFMVFIRDFSFYLLAFWGSSVMVGYERV
jgi:ABC-type uncharacterized transport system permease subunit